MAEKDERTYIRLHDGMPDHPKVEALSDKAFRLLVSTWCWCSRHLTDGRVPLAVWRKRGTPKTRRELVEAGLVEQHDDHVMMHDYLEHQRSADEVAERKEVKRKAGALGNHNRWHVPRGIYDADCPICVANGHPQASHMGSQERSQTRSVDNSESGNESILRDANDTSNQSRTSTESDSDGTSQPRQPETARPGETDGAQSKTASQVRSRRDRKTSPETETETETQLSSGHFGEGASPTERASDPPAPKTLEGSRPADRCPRHVDHPDPPPCGQCADARRAAEAFDARQAAQRRRIADELDQARRDRRMDCDHGTPAGRYIRPDTGQSPCPHCRRIAEREAS